MKILILNPNFNIEKKSIINVRLRQPLSLAIIASILRNDGHQIVFLDANALNFTFNQIISEIKKIEPDVLILTSTPIDRWECPNSHIDFIFEIIKAVKIKYKIITGSHGTVMPEWIFKKSGIDFVVRGEPELIVRELISCLDKGGKLEDISGLSFRQGKSIVNNKKAERIKDLDLLPLPAYDLLPMSNYGNSGYPSPFSIMMTSRGCPFNCSFCLKAMVPGAYIARQPEKVIEEIRYLIENFSIKSIYFQDWEFLIDESRIEKICDLIIKNKLDFKWGCNARATDVIRSKGLIEKMKIAGCFAINIGLESASNKILDNIDKQLTKNDLQQAVDILRANNLGGGFYVLLNCPGEDKNTIRETIDFIAKNNIKVKNFNLPIPYPGTKLFAELRKQYSGVEFSWDNIEKFAGRVAVVLNPVKARLYAWHYKYLKKYGRFYYLRLIFWKDII